MGFSISVIVPAYNEEQNLEPTIDGILKAIDNNFDRFKIIIVNDGSTDRTGLVADSLGSQNPCITVIHNEKNMGFGYNFRLGLQMASCQYVALIPGDNEISHNSINDIFKLVGRADIISPYVINTWARPFSRRILSKTYTFLVNLFFGLKLRYYNGPAVHRVDLLRKIRISTYGFAFLSEIMVKLIRSGSNYTEVGIYLNKREYGKSSAFKIKNVISVIKTVVTLFFVVNFKEKRKYK